MSAVRDDMLGTSVTEFLDGLAARTPTPGGGSVAALAGALSCAMARMVVAYSKSDAERVAMFAGRLEKADRMLRTLIAEDIAAYEALSAASREAKKDPAAADRKQQALIAASLVPMEMAATATTALAAMDEFKSMAGKHLLGDLGVAAVIGRACVQAAAYSVRVNAIAMAEAQNGRQMTAETERLTARAGDLCASVEAFVAQALK